MALAKGTKLGHYEIRALIGVGGMGEVYRAHDTKLARDVALKVLPEAFARDPDRLARFRREARLLASLNHHNIAAIYGLEDSGDTHFLVMELVEGDTLRDQITRDGAVPVEEALRIASQIAEGLEAAHEKNTIHRDLKPANVKVTPEGLVKVLDFGLAKAFAAEESESDIHNAPTLSASPTIPGAILGTPAYMSPEQAKGKKVDRRTDIWALGCVLYELLTGQGAFHRNPSRAHPSRDREGAVSPSRARQQAVASPAMSQPLPHGRGSDEPDTVQEIIARVLQAEPDWTALPENTPYGIRVLLRRCLEKSPNERFRDAADVRIQIKEALAAPAPTAAAPMPTRAGWRRGMQWLAIFLAGALLATLAVWNLRPSAPTGVTGVARVTVNLLPGEQLAGVNLPLAVSSDGTHLAYVANRGGTPQLYLRAMDNPEAKPLPGTEGAAAPFFSPDGQWIAFFAEGKLKKVSITGGSLQTLCDAPGGQGGSWGPDDTIFFPPYTDSALWKVPASGGQPQEVTTLDRSKGEFSHRFPQVLPGGKALLFTVRTAQGWDGSQIVAQELATGERRVLVQGGAMGLYTPSGHLIYARAGTLLALPFDLARLEVTSSAPVTIAEGVLVTATVGAAFASSSTGSLAYVPANPHQLERRLVWVGRKGGIEPIPAPPRFYLHPALSPDGRRAAFDIRSATADIWILELERGALTRLTSEAGGASSPIWTPDGKRIIYWATRASFRNLFWRAADGTGGEERLTTSEEYHNAYSVSPDGKVLAFRSSNPTTRSDIWVLPLDGTPSRAAASEGERKPQVFLKTPFNEEMPMFSPDGRWLAYRSDESGRNEIYVQPFPGPGAKRQVSIEGGDSPVWARNGRELFYRNGDKMMAVDITTQPTFSAGSPRLLFEGRYEEGTSGTGYDVSLDGQRFLMVQSVEPEQPATQINVILNWFEELKRRVPVKQ